MGKSYNVEKADQVHAPFWSSFRLWLAIVGFFGCTTIYLMRINLSLSIVCMVEGEEEDIYYNVTTTNADLPSQHGEFDWDKQTQGYILSSFYWGYILTQIVGGWLARKYGAKEVMVLGVLVATICTFLSPPAARLSAYGLMTMRIINGLGQGVWYPASYHLFSGWSPPDERSRLITTFLTGSTIGSVVTFICTGFICEYLGWIWTFHIYGFVACLYMVWWMYCVYNWPAEHPRIPEEEQLYIEESLGNQDIDASEEKKRSVPWKALCSSFPPHAIFVADFCRAWGSYTNLTCLPQYMNDVLEFDITTNGLMNSLPHLCNFVFSLLFGQLADCLIKGGYMSITRVRKLMETIGLLPAAALFIGTGYLDKDQAYLAVTFICLAESFSAATRSGHSTNMIDIAPRYAGMIMGVSNTIGNVPGALAPIVVGAITTDGTQEQWQIVFYLSASIYVFGWIVYFIFASGEVQPWALDPEDDGTLEMTVGSGSIEKIPDVLEYGDKCSDTGVPGEKTEPGKDGVDNVGYSEDHM